MDKKVLAIPLILVVAVAGAVFIYQNQQSSIQRVSLFDSRSEHIVEMRKDGFDPQTLIIKKGDIVTFIPVEEGEYWPASDPHPEHNFLEGFDSQEPINGGSWSFTFTEADTWRYHNHLSVALRGTIIVIGENAAGDKDTAEGNCSYNDEVRCFDEKIRHILGEEGIAAAFALFANLYETQKAPASCHWTAHLIGEEAYRQFSAGNEFAPTRATSYCTWGFYHGFMETLLRDDRDLEKASKFCTLVGDKLGREAKDNCYHGIGHGFTDDPPHPSAWGDADAVLGPVLAACEQLLGDTENKWEICSTGGYSVLVDFMAGGKYGFFLDPEDPFSLCRTQPKRYSRACYGEIAPRLDSLTGWDVSQIPNFIKNIEEESTKEFIVRVASATMMQRDVVKDDLTNYIEGCRTLPENLLETCIDGVVWGLLYHGPPEKEYEKPLKFCASAVFTRQEKDFCYRDTFSRIEKSYPYPVEKLKSICQSVPEEYRSYCEFN